MKITGFFELLNLYFNLVACCVVYANIYPLIGRLLSYNYSYVKLPNYKKMYVVKNILKSIMMLYLCIDTYTYIYELIFLNIFRMDILRWWGTLYVANDLTGLLMVEKLPQNTKNHHLMTLLLLNVVFLFDGNEMEMVKFIIIYTIFSYFSFLVNLYLGCRFLILDINENNKVSIRINRCIDILRHLAFYNYSISLFINWLFHLYYGLFCLTSLGLSHVLYLCFLVPIVNDDIILLKWLRNKSLTY
jgi:hypothetical protein